MKKKRSTVFKTTVMSFAAIATSLTFGMAACSNGNGNSDDEDDKTTTKIDSQIIKNGNFEFYSDNKGLYPISNPDSWTGSTNGSSSASMSGVIDTRKERWDYLTDPDLPQILEDNDDLKSDDKNKKDYNGALTDDMPYKNPHAATEGDATSDDKAYIDNPFTHSYSYDADGKIYDVDGKEVTTYKDEDGKLYLDEKHETPLETSVLMIHNYRKSYFTGTECYFKSSTNVTLEASTACEISVWVKTSELYYGGATATRTEVEFERGAYIKVDTSVGGNSLDSFTIKNINTKKLNTDNANNGWVQYTVYVEASNFADTTVNVTLGLGEDSAYTVEGYAFFDDLTFTKYLNKSEMSEKSGAFNEKVDENNTSYPLAPDAKTEFRADKEVYQTNGNDGAIEEVIKENNFDDRHFFIDLASSTKEDTLKLDSQNVAGGLTVEETSTGKYVSAKPSAGDKYGSSIGELDNGAAEAYLPSNLRPNGLNTKDDVLAATTVTNDENWKFTLGTDYIYSDVLTNALKSAVKLPGVEGGRSYTLVMMSARGAAYEAVITDNSFVLDDGEYALISFWLKTSDMGGKTAATVTVSGIGDDKDNKAAFDVDTTTQSLVDIGDNKDVYDGWVKCFVRVSNVSKVDGKQFKITVNFGNTTIKGTNTSSYKSGWLALTNVSLMKLDKDVYGYSSGGAHTATIAFNEVEQNTTHNFDSEQGDKNVIKNNLAVPSAYTGVNGASINVVPTGDKATEYDATNKNAYAGLLNKEYVNNYNGKEWFNSLRFIDNLQSATADEVWKSVFGGYTVQPLLIVNSPRTFAEQKKIYNYGYIGGSQTVSANGYSAISVRVKASRGAVANVYLTENKVGGGSQVMSYELPKYNFWYDDAGNILKGEPDKNATSSADKKANIAYKLRKDGLYENGDGKLYANFYNLTRYYDTSFEHNDFYNENGELVSFENLVQGETYYADSAKTKYAPHHLIAGGKANNKVYEYNTGKDGEACYYYMENGKANKNKVVYGVNTEVAKMRYDNTAAQATPYQFTIDGDKYNGEWVTVTFYIHAGSEAKDFRLELWSGARDEQSSYDTNAESYVIFDYSSITLDQSTYDGLVSGYTNQIIADYREKISGGLADNDANIAELEKLAGADNRSDLFDYIATYHTFSLYDSQAFIPFNGETAKNDKSGYSFDYTESLESLAFLRVTDNGRPSGSSTDDSIYTLSAFIDYSVIDKDIEIIGEPTAPDNSGDNTDTKQDTVNAWLLAASIALVVAIFVAIAAIFIKDFVKKRRRSKTAGKNSYNFNKNKRYVKKYVKANGDVEEIAEGEVDESLLSDKPAETEAPAEESAETVEEAQEESNVAESSENAEEKPESGEKPAEEAKPDEDKGEEPKPEDGEDK